LCDILGNGDLGILQESIISSPLVSIALCTYNGAKYLPQQLESVLAQTHRPLELVAADDCSSDGTWGILETYAPHFDYVKLIRNQRTLGVNANFEQAMRACGGEWVAPCDQDDIWCSDKLRRLLGASDGAQLVYCDSEYIDFAGRLLGKRISDDLRMIDGSDPRVLTFSNCVSGHALLVHRDIVTMAFPFPSDIYYDWWLAFVAASIGSIRYLDEPLVQFRRHRGTVTHLGAERPAFRLGFAARHRMRLSMFASFAKVPSAHQEFYCRLRDLWEGRENKWVTPELAFTYLRHRKAFETLGYRDRSKGIIGDAWRYFFGLRAKSLYWRLRGR
jgi:glycosyltransferase involved in cell wall biosynthesis